VPYQPSPELAAFLHDLPKTETHLHIEGALPFHLAQGFRPDQLKSPPASWADDFKFRSFAHFEEELLAMAAAYHHSPEQYFRSAQEVFGKLFHEQNVRYLECSFASGVLEFIGGDGPATCEAIKRAVPAGMDVRVYLGIHHLGYNEQTRPWIDESPHWEYLDGVDLHGPEDHPMGDWAPRLWEAFRAAGKQTKAHAGEFCGPEMVRYALDELKTTRIQHGVRSVEDPALVARLAAEDITLDVCPISNVKLDVVPTMAQHPIRQLLDAGVRCTISTDDPISFGNQLHEEYTALSQDLGFSFAELAKIAKNGFAVADLPEARKASLYAEIDAVLARHTA
jgi:adenosine deaminase